MRRDLRDLRDGGSGSGAHHGRKTRAAAASSCAFHAAILGWLMNGCREEDPQSSPPQSWSCVHKVPTTSVGFNVADVYFSRLKLFSRVQSPMRGPRATSRVGPAREPRRPRGRRRRWPRSRARSEASPRSPRSPPASAARSSCRGCARTGRCVTCARVASSSRAGRARGDKAIEWQPLANPGMRRLCACPTCGGKTGLQKCNNCVGLGYA